MYQRSELDYLIYNDSIAYADLIRNDNPEAYLNAMTKSGNSLAFEYNASGVRTKKTANGIVHNYYLNGVNVLLETTTNGSTINVIQYIYDNNNEVRGLDYNGTKYYFVKNLQGDVIRIVDSNRAVVVKYVYDVQTGTGVVYSFYPLIS